MIPIRDTIRAQHKPVVTLGLIGINIVFFLRELALSPFVLERFFHLWGVVPARFMHPEWAAGAGYPKAFILPFLTSMFLHGGWLHIIGNMWALWLFGDNVEDRMGHFRFFFFYILCGLVAGAANVIIYPNSRIPTIGASGAIAGVMGAYFILFPLARILVLVPVFFYPLLFEVPAVVYLFFWFFSQFWSGTLALVAGKGGFGGVAFWAHVGGFIAGILLLRLFLKRKGKRNTGFFNSFIQK